MTRSIKTGSIMAICSCRGPDGKPYPKGQCPRWNQRGHRAWYFVIDLDRKDGKRQQLRSPRYPTRAQAGQALLKEMPSIAAHTAPTLDDRQTTVAEYLAEWLHTARKADGEPWRPSTVMTYRGAVENYLRPHLGRYLLADLRRKHIEGLAAKMHGDGLSRRTVHQAYSTLRTALTQAMIDNMISANPCKAARVPGPGQAPPRFWEPEQVAVFLEHTRQAEPRLAPAFQIAAQYGPRRGELSGFCWDDFDPDAGTLKVARNVTEADREAHVGPPKTLRGERTISLGDTMAAVLRAHRKAQAAERLAAGPAWETGPDGGWIFPGKNGAMLRPFVLTHTFKSLARELPELPDLHLHGLRHTAASNMLLLGIPPEVVADQLGHDVATLLKVYAHVLPRQRAASAAAVDRLYERSTGTSVTTR